MTYSEESAISIQFAKTIFDRAGQKVRVVCDHKVIEDEMFDVIVCLDVLEHVPDPPAMVQSMAKQLEPGGHMIVHAPFFFLTSNNPTHLASNRKFSGDFKRLYAPAGLHVSQADWFWDPIVLTNDREKRARGFGRIRFRVGGALLSLARVWKWPHEFVGLRQIKSSNPKWLEDLLKLKQSLDDWKETDQQSTDQSLARQQLI